MTTITDRARRVFCLCLALLLLSATRSHAAFAGFLRIQGVQGGSTAAMHEGEIDVLALHWRVQSGIQAVGSTPLPAERPTFEALTLTKPLDKASPILAHACAAGTHFPSAVLTLFSTGDKAQRFMKYKLGDVIVSAVEVDGAGEGDDAVPSETVGLLYSRIEFIFTDGKGAIAAGWDVLAGKKL